MSPLTIMKQAIVVTFLASAATAAFAASKTSVVAPTTHPMLTVEHKVYGVVESLSGTTLAIKNRAGVTMLVDVRAARSNLAIDAGRPVLVRGTVDANGRIHATAVWRTFSDSAHWPADI